MMNTSGLMGYEKQCMDEATASELLMLLYLALALALTLGLTLIVMKPSMLLHSSF